jgi:LPXTG-site transpeptidase (sortase) family protein
MSIAAWVCIKTSFLYPHGMPRKRLNLILELVVLTLGLYLVLYPLYPNLTLWLAELRDTTGGFKYDSLAAREAGFELPEAPDGNRVIIPAIKVDTEIHEGSDASTLDYGVWRRPQTSTPNEGGNTVLTAHRFLYTAGPNTFFHLDKVAVGDSIVVFWDDVEHSYEIEEIRVVPPSEVSVEAPTSTNERAVLTLYTCTPLWSSTNRLVVRAREVSS